jgi:hypothetical protein
VSEDNEGKAKGQNLLSGYIEHNHADVWKLEQYKTSKSKAVPVTDRGGL